MSLDKVSLQLEAPLGELKRARLMKRHHIVIRAHQLAVLSQGADGGINITVIGQIHLQLRRRRPRLERVRLYPAAGRIRDSRAGAKTSCGRNRVPLPWPAASCTPARPWTHFSGSPPFGSIRIWEAAGSFPSAPYTPTPSPQLHRGISLQPHLVLKIGLRRLIGHIHAAPIHIILPPVVHAAQTGLLVATQKQRGSPMGTPLIQQPDSACGVAEGHQALPQKSYPHRWPVGLQLPREQRRDPVPSHQYAQRSPRPRPRHQLVLFSRQHRLCNPLCYFSFRTGPEITIE